MNALFYVDPSAAVKLAVNEAHAPFTRTLLLDGDSDLISSRIAELELRRALWRRQARDDAADDVCALLRLMSLSPTVIDRASRVNPATLSSLDALHLASAAMVHETQPLTGFVTFDRALSTAAAAAGLVNPVAHLL